MSTVPRSSLGILLKVQIIFLNTLNGEIRVPISKFILDYAERTEVFCFQEVYEADGGMKELADDLLKNFISVGANKYIGGDGFFQRTYISKNIKNVRSETVFPDNMQTGLGISTTVFLEGRQISICNFHGLSQPGDKLDNQQRLAQSKGIINYFKKTEGNKIIGGDFNLAHDSQSVKMFESAGYRNLIDEYKIRTTRNAISWRMYPDSPQFYSDYVFVSPETKVTKFEVPENEVSDHLPLILRIE